MRNLKSVEKQKGECVERADEVIPQLPIGKGNKPLNNKGGKQ